MGRWIVAGLVAASWGCSPSGSDTTLGDTGRDGADVWPEVGDGGPCSGPGDCDSGWTCSAAGRCMPSGTCLVDPDCAPGEHCGRGSLRCLAAGACEVAADCDDGYRCDEATSACVPETCGGAEFDITRMAPNVMILVDRSGSMERDAGGRPRWDVAKEAIGNVTGAFDAQIRFGLATFSSCLPGGCSAGSIVVPIAETNATAINDFLAPLLSMGSPAGTPPWYLCDSGDPETSTGRSLEALVGEPSLQDPARTNAVLLVTDGEESSDCTDGGSVTGPTGAASLLAQSPSVKTYVVGFGADAPAGPLNAVAAAGGTGTYHSADDAASLLAAFETIATDVASCEYVLDGDVPDASEIYVYLNDEETEVPRDPADGWTYDPATRRLEFHGGPCDRILSGEITDIDVVYGCPGPVIG